MASDAVAVAWAADKVALDSLLGAMEHVLAKGEVGASAGGLRETFKLARIRYKRQEHIWEYHFPLLAGALNGPAIDEVERDCEHTVVPARGLQTLEAFLYPGPLDSAGEALALIAGMRALLVDSVTRTIDWSDSSLLDAVRFELFRLANIGSSGFDSPAAGQSLVETRAALQGMGEALEARFSGRPAGAEALAQFLALNRAVEEFLQTHSDLDSFDHGQFMVEEMNPLYGALGDLQQAMSIPFASQERPYAADAKNLFAPEAWNLRHFAPPFARNANSDHAALGRSLFFDPVLSGTGSRSCATCHQPELAFTDGLPKSISVSGHGTVARNAPTVIHAAFQQGAFADLRAESLEDQASMVVHNVSEMDGNLDSAAARLNRHPEYARRFLEAFSNDSIHRDRDLPATPVRIRIALAAYTRSLVSFNSPWDRFIQGDRDALSSDARRGFNVFMGKGACATCHFPPLFNGTRPPFYTRTDLEVLGVPGKVIRSKPPRYFPDPDSGRMVIDHAAPSLRAFKTPTLRNVAFTGPYMHNGVFATLEEVIDFYDAGGGAGLGLDVPNQTVSSDSLKLVPGEKQALLAFLRALSDTTGLTAKPVERRGQYAGTSY